MPTPIVVNTSAMSTPMENKLISHILLNSLWSGSPTRGYLALYSSDPSTYTGVGLSPEVSETSTSYVRQPVTFSTSRFGWTANSQWVLFDKATGDWGPVSYAGICSGSSSGSSSSGSLLFYGEISHPINVRIGERVSIAPGNLQVYFSQSGAYISEYVANGILNGVLCATGSIPSASTVYIGLGSGEEHDFSEQSSASTGYTRQRTESRFWSTPTAGSTVCSASYTFSAGILQEWTPCNAVALYNGSASSAGVVLFWYPLALAFSGSVGDFVISTACSISFQMDKP